MAEFQKVMREWVRARKSIDENKLTDCPLEMFTNDFIANIEKEVMTWAAEHPEPIYPMWGEYLAEKGELCKNWKDIRVILNTDNSTSGVIGWFYKNVPADVAQKLGIKPKENIC